MNSLFDIARNDRSGRWFVHSMPLKLRLPRLLALFILIMTACKLQAATDLPFPYATGFDTTAERDLWQVSGFWGIATGTAERPSLSGDYHLDNNPDGQDQYSAYLNSQVVLADWRIAIPADASRPVLSYWYRLQLLDGDLSAVEVMVSGSFWRPIKAYARMNNHSGYVRETLDLSEFRGQTIQLRFNQYSGAQHGARHWQIDDLRIDEEQLPVLAYPYGNGFESQAEQAEWNLQGNWYLSDEQGGHGNHSGGYHLDGNPTDLDQFAFFSGQLATLNGVIEVPADAVRPVLSYWHRFEVDWGDFYHVDIRPASGDGSWQLLKTYDVSGNNAAYQLDVLDLSAYRGESIQLRFRQNNTYRNGTRVWQIDDLSVGEGASLELAYPYRNGFETQKEQADWNLQGNWALSAAQGAHENHAGGYHLDGNPTDRVQDPYFVSHIATLRGRIEVPADAVRPVLSYWYQLGIGEYDFYFVEIRSAASAVWTVLTQYSNKNNHIGYVRETLDLSPFRGQSIELRFRQSNLASDTARLWLVDDLWVGEEQFATLTYPYQNGFETQAEQADWNLQGRWGLSGELGDHANHSGDYHLDANPADQNQYANYNGQLATLNGAVSVPENAVQPALHFWLRLQLEWFDSYSVEIRESGAVAWSTLKSYNWMDNSSDYRFEIVDLSAYRGKTIQLRFRQNNAYIYGARLWLIDDLRIGVNATYDQDGDGIPDIEDPDRDGDGVENTQDAFPDNPGEWSDMDGDGIGDNTDPDRDGDGVVNDLDLFPDNPAEWSDMDGDGIGDNGDPDRDGDGIGNDYETQVGTDPNDPNSTPPDLDGDGIPDSLDDDRDGDGVLNDQDSYPDDATRFRLAPVAGLVSSQQGAAVIIQWQAHPETFVQGYRLYRADYGQADWTVLNSGGLLTATQYTDDSAANGEAYAYRVSAVDDRGNEGIESAAVGQFVIYNLNRVTDTQAEWVDYQARISWNHSAATNESYRLYRVEADGKVLVLDDVNTAYLDTASHWNSDQRYELASVLSFTNPITSSTEQAEGPATPIQLLALPAIEASLSNVTRTGTDSYRIESQAGLQLLLSGQYVHALAPVAVVLNNSQGATTVNSDNGEFQFVVRETALESMSITLTETGAPADRTVTLTLDVIADQTPLTVELDALADTQEGFVSVNGRVLNADAGVARVSASSDRFPGQSFGLTLAEGDELFGEVPLKAGENLITVEACGNQGQSDQASATVTRLASRIPVIEYTSHHNNDIVSVDHITLQGRVYTSLASTQLQLKVNGVAVNISSVLENLYRFELADVRLNRGFNRIVTVAETPFGSVESALVVYYQDAAVDPQAPLEIAMTTPLDGATVSDDLLLVRGQLFNAGDTATLTVNGSSTALYGNAAGQLFSTALDISAVPQGPYTVTLHAEAEGKDPVDLLLSLVKDAQAPVIKVDNALSAPPAVNEIQQHPYRISGTVSDGNLSTVSINGNNLVLENTVVADEYRFEADLALEAGVETELVVLAVDTGGNASSVRYTVLSNPAASLEVIRPLSGAEYRTTGAEFDVEYVVKLDDGSVGKTLAVTAGSRRHTTTITQALLNDVIAIDTSESISQLIFEVVDASNVTLSSTSVDVTFVNEDNLPLQLLRTVPDRNAQYREPHHPIQFYFNRPVALADLEITVKQSVHGMSYVSSKDAQTAPGAKYQGEVIEVHKDQESVPGGLSLLPGGRIVEFYPDNDIAYGATVYVGVSHQGGELSRFVYRVRENPTFIGGVVFSQDQVALEGIKVELPELGVSATTDPNGTYSLGAGVPASRTVASGLYRLVVNPDGENSAYGSIERMVSLEQGRVNQLQSLRIPRIDTLLPYNRLDSGVPSNVLAGGDLIIDTSNAVLSFADGNRSASVQTQLQPVTSGLYVAQHQALTPHWMFNLQPGPIEVSGEVTLQITMPALYGSYDYLPGDDAPVLIMGQDADSLEVVLLGVGMLNGRVVTTPVSVQPERLDFIGVSMVAEEQYDLLMSYIDGDISLAQLLISLTADVQ